MTSTWDPYIGSDLVTQVTISDILQSSYDKVDYFRINAVKGYYIISFKFDYSNDLGYVVLSICSGNLSNVISSVQGYASNGELYIYCNIPENYGFDSFVRAQIVSPSGRTALVNYSLSISSVDATPPTVSSIAYGTNDGALSLGEAVTLTVTLNETVNVTGTPTIALANGGTATYTGGTGTTQLTFSYTAAAGQTTADLATASTNALTGTIKDGAGNAVTATGFNNVNPAGTLAVDVTAPIASTYAPTDGATGVAVDSNIVLTFSEAIAKGTGTITLRSGSATGTVVESFDAATSTRITVSGSTLTIDPTSNLANSTQYFVVFASGTVKDIAGNA